MHIQIGKQLVELLREEPKAECGHGLTAAIGIVLLAALLIALKFA